MAEAVQSYDAYGKVSALITGPGTDTVWFTADDVLAANPNVSAIGNPWFYTGQRLDGETGLMYYKNRYHSVDLGRFVSRDPIGYGIRTVFLADKIEYFLNEKNLGLNMGLFSYVAGQVTKYSDKKGLRKEIVPAENLCGIAPFHCRQWKKYCGKGNMGVAAVNNSDDAKSHWVRSRIDPSFYFHCDRNNSRCLDKSCRCIIILWEKKGAGGGVDASSSECKCKEFVE